MRTLTPICMLCNRGAESVNRGAWNSFHAPFAWWGEESPPLNVPPCLNPDSHD